MRYFEQKFVKVRSYGHGVGKGDLSARGHHFEPGAQGIIASEQRVKHGLERQQLLRGPADIRCRGDEASWDVAIGEQAHIKVLLAQRLIDAHDDILDAREAKRALGTVVLFEVEEIICGKK